MSWHEKLREANLWLKENQISKQDYKLIQQKLMASDQYRYSSECNQDTESIGDFWKLDPIHNFPSYSINQSRHKNQQIAKLVGDFSLIQVNPNNSAELNERIKQRISFIQCLRVPHILQFYASNSDTHFTAMAGFIPVDFLDKLILSPIEALNVLQVLCETIDDLHKEAFIHFDLRSDAISIDSHKRPLISNFGIPPKDSFASKFDSPRYLSEEELLNDEFLIDYRSIGQISQSLLPFDFLKDPIERMKSESRKYASCREFILELKQQYFGSAQKEFDLKWSEYFKSLIAKTNQRLELRSWTKAFLMLQRLKENPSDNGFRQLEETIPVNTGVPTSANEAQSYCVAIFIADYELEPEDLGQIHKIYQSLGLIQQKTLQDSKLVEIHSKLNTEQQKYLHKIGPLIAEGLFHDLVAKPEHIVIAFHKRILYFHEGSSHSEYPSSFYIEQLKFPKSQSSSGDMASVSSAQSKSKKDNYYIALALLFLCLVLAYIAWKNS